MIGRVVTTTVPVFRIPAGYGAMNVLTLERMGAWWTAHSDDRDELPAGLHVRLLATGLGVMNPRGNQCHVAIINQAGRYDLHADTYYMDLEIAERLGFFAPEPIEPTDLRQDAEDYEPVDAFVETIEWVEVNTDNDTIATILTGNGITFQTTDDKRDDFHRWAFQRLLGRPLLIEPTIELTEQGDGVTHWVARLTIEDKLRIIAHGYIQHNDYDVASWWDWLGAFGEQGLVGWSNVTDGAEDKDDAVAQIRTALKVIWG